MGDGGRFVGGGGGGGVVARGDWRLALRGDATSAAELLGEGSGSALSALTGSSVQRAASGAWPATRNIELSASAPR
jgi:hypothetical protein